MKMRMRCFALCVALLHAAPVAAAAAEQDADKQAVRMGAWLSSDTDGHETQRVSVGWDVSHRDLQHWWGGKVERARFSGEGWSDTEQRVYLAGAGEWAAWSWDGDVGTNGEDVLGRASVHSRDARRKEFFVERDVLETRDGVANGWLQTFAGAAIDLPMGERWSATLLGGLQEFGTGDNLRTHLRGNLVHVVAPEQGLSLQLRTRYFHDTDPGEANYFSPDWYGEAIGAVGWRRFVGGYQWRALAGVGRQRTAGEGSRRARLLQVGFETPRWKDAWMRLDAGYSDTPTLSGNGAGRYAYRYVQLQGFVAF